MQWSPGNYAIQIKAGSDNLDSGIKEIEETLVIKDMILTIGTQN